MTSKKKQSEGIALLSMYNDEEEEDEEMEDVDEQEHDQSEHEEQYREPSDAVAVDEDSAAAHLSDENMEELLQSVVTKNSIGDNEGAENREGSGGDTGGVSGEIDNPLDKFLPPPPKEPCLKKLQEKIERFLELKETGRSFNAEVRKKKAYRNPDFLLHAVRYQEIDQIGSCYDKNIFDPHGYDKSDFFDEIEADMRRERERKDQELKKSPKVEFVPGGIQPGVVVSSSKFSLPLPAVNSVPSAADPVAREGRQNKKSKWDKVDDGRIPIAAGGQDPLATAAAHAASLSAANGGAGYSAFVQQRRREAEEKKSSERKLERRS